MSLSFKMLQRKQKIRFFVLVDMIINTCADADALLQLTLDFWRFVVYTCNFCSSGWIYINVLFFLRGVLLWLGIVGYSKFFC
ncbi:hypothetical protein DSUL_40096 [Desulfovibrionales bacterium]